MQRALLIKAVLIVTLFALLQVPLRMIDGIVAERSARQQAVVCEMASASYGPQVLAGPILSLPYVEEYDEAMSDERGRRVERRRIERVARYFPRDQHDRGERERRNEVARLVQGAGVRLARHDARRVRLRCGGRRRAQPIRFAHCLGQTDARRHRV